MKRKRWFVSLLCVLSLMVAFESEAQQSEAQQIGEFLSGSLGAFIGLGWGYSIG